MDLHGRNKWIEECTEERIKEAALGVDSVAIDVYDLDNVDEMSNTSKKRKLIRNDNEEKVSQKRKQVGRNDYVRRKLAKLKDFFDKRVYDS
mmetsp:Transcript_23166/g.23375  ORF Transcript_23166/g.23375 Transcript_23166/m.23375 type:complete len:91 (-) Transcript_23166:87-359(-)